ncbi:uncharacterized protein B0I36DRAFT_256736 [Microdochium trichocladiopsis]|uniref:BTB domain-containing protein n=1 Tax=Microdochium trichocladiopsis TaxID=1682393 RepID=A0A9P9BL32_9PEZI|nr:uncharacterized protein B0I36DRAFT_256736 [Microdochium trichocladiopsis]KAH7012273.1 hypothetical protein B0I36DRAFT_256736 [Microdochium trichocladiopsis]
MSYEAAVRREVYLSWKPVFTLGSNWQLRKPSKIQAVVSKYAPLHYYFWHPNIIKILGSLLEDHVFLSDEAARRVFPDIFDQVSHEKQDSSLGNSRLPPQPEASVEMMKGLTSLVQGLYRSGEYSDLLVRCGQDSYPVHKAIVCPQSAYFATACKGSFKEGRTGEISLLGDDPQAVGRMMFYFYHRDYTWEPPLSGSVPGSTIGGVFEDDQADLDESFDHNLQDQMHSALSFHTAMYALADKYLVPELKALAVTKFRVAARGSWSARHFLDSTQKVYTSTPETDRGMRDVVVEVFQEHIELLDMEEARQVLKTLPALTYDVLISGHRNGWR